MSTTEGGHPPQLRPQLITLTIAGVFALLASWMLLGGASATRTVPILAKARNIPTGAMSQNSRAAAYEQTSREASRYSENVFPQTSEALATASPGDHVYIDFGNFPSGTLITNQYPPAVFSTDSPLVPVINGHDNYGSSFPNFLNLCGSSSPGYPGPYCAFAPLYVDFTTPVNNLIFYVVAVDEFRRGIAQVNIFQNHKLVATRNIDGFGNVYRPVPVDVGGMGFNSVTRIEIVNIDDYLGVGFDDFSFTIAPPPSPTPTPTPPLPTTPTGLTATASDQQVSLSWNASEGADGYYVKRSGGTPNLQTIAAVSSPSGATNSIIVPSPATSYIDTAVKGGTTYTYAVSAFNNAGESAKSNEVSATVPSACGDQSIPLPGPTYIPRGASGWEMTVEVSPNDGVVLHNVSLNGRYMAQSISVPYFTIGTSTTSGVIRGELKPNGDSTALRSRLVEFVAADAGFGVYVFAHYIVDHISPSSDSCLHVWERYVFASRPLTQLYQGGSPCEPSGTLPCQTFYPTVSYKFESRGGEVLYSFNAVQRNAFAVQGSPFNSIGLFRDCDYTPGCIFRLEGYVFKYKWNPLNTELKARVIQGGHDFGTWDNIHQTYNSKIFDEPGIDFRHLPPFSGGCQECVHMHWRWGRAIPGDSFGAGTSEFYYPQSNQDMDIAIVKYKALEQENAEPLDYASLANWESIRLGSDVGDQVLVYYSATGHQNEDTFFRHLYFFNPDFGSSVKPLQRNPPVASGNSTATAQDGPISVSFPHVYQDGGASFTETDPATVAPLPPGYVAYNSVAYNIATEGEASGPYVVSFNVPSATDQSVFSTLRILHAEPDPLDPETAVWVDRAILSPDAQGPDFNGKIINAKANNLGPFMIVKLTQAQPPNTGTADLAVNSSSAPDPVVAPNNLTYTVTINNAGPDAATGVGLIDSLSADVEFVSASSGQGNCKFVDGSVYCKLGSLNSGASAVVTIVVTPNEGGTRFPAEGQSVPNTAFVVANENDPNKNNNSFVKSSTVLPNPNVPPTVDITSPASGARYAGPANISVTANASDSDGTITQVNFYDNGTLIGSGTPVGSNQYSLAWNNVGFGNHSLAAVATDNGGRKKISSPMNIMVNGPASISINSPATGSVIAPHSNIVVTANASIPSGVINKVDFFANSTLLGTVNSAGQSSVNWNDVPNGKYSLTAVATDGSGITTTSMPVSVVVSNPPTISISSPQDGTSFGPSSVFIITANVQDDDSIIHQVNFLANGTVLGTGLPSGLNQFTFKWRGAPDGIYALTATATDQYGLTTTSPGITVGVNAQVPIVGEFVWFDDALPQGALKHTESEDWYWVDANPGSFSSRLSHQSLNFGQVGGVHRHYFDGATTTLPVNAGDKLFTYLFLDINNMPREIMLEWKDANGWEHRAYWGQNNISLGSDGTSSRHYMGPLPKDSTWVRLEVPASAVGLEGATLNGMSFALDGGRATWDFAGTATANATHRPTTPPGDSVWIEDSLPAGAVPAVIDDNWNWVSNPPPFSGQRDHLTFFDAGGNKKFRSHSFTGAQTPMQVNSGDVLFTYVYIFPDQNSPAIGDHVPNQIMLQWYDGKTWEHRAYWGRDYIGQQISNMGVRGTENHRFMGGMPTSVGWHRLEVPASYVGLEGKLVSGMAFTVYRDQNNPHIAWDYSGKSPQSKDIPLPLSATTGAYRFYSSSDGWAYDTNEVEPPAHSLQKNDAFFVDPKPAAGTVPMYRFHNKDHPYTHFYARCRECYDGNGWVFDNVAFHVFADGSTPGTVPLYLYHDTHSHYLMTIDQSEATGTLDGIWAYVYPSSMNVPVSPRLNLLGGRGSCSLYWFNNPLNVTGFKIEAQYPGDATWTKIATVGPDATSYNACQSGSTPEGSPQQESLTAKVVRYRMRATSLFGDSAYSNEAVSCPGPICTEGGGPVNSPPELSIVSPANGDVVDHNLVITANAFDLDGAGTIAKVEFFANGTKLGEVATAPYLFPWNNVALGTYSLAATVTDDAGAMTTSAPVSVTVGKSNQTIAFDAIPDRTYGDAPFTISASSSSGLAVSFSIASGQPATISGNTITITGVGSVSVRAVQVGSDSFNSAPPVTQPFNVATATAGVTLTNLTQTYDGAAHYASATTSPANLSVNLTYGQGGSNVNSPTNAGSYSVTATVNDPNYQASATNTLTIAKAAQTITFNPLAGKTYGNADFAVGATTSSGLVPSFSVVSGPATISGSTVHITGVGSVKILASQAGDGNYSAAAPNVDQTFAVARASQAITFGVLSNKTYGDAPFTVSATGGSSSNPVTFSASGNCTAGGANGSTITIAGSGSCSVTAAQAGNSNYNAALNVSQNFTISKATAAIMLGSLNQTYNGTPRSASATTNPTGLSSISFTYNDSPTAPTNAGSYSVAASLDNPNYSGTATGTLVITKATPIISWSNPADISYGTALSSTQLNATASFGGSSVAGTFAYSPGAGTVLKTGDTQKLDTTFTPTDGVNFSTPPTGHAYISVTQGCGGTSGYAFQRSIIIDHTKVPNMDQSSFPVLISGTYSYLATVSNGGRVQNANGYDIVFYADAGRTTKLNHEIEKYVATTGEIEMWVRIPTLSHTTDTVIYMVYGDSAITTSQENKTGVWDTNFRGVWHMGDGTTLSAKDSTSNAKDGTINGATATSGQIGGGASLSGSSQNITTAANIDLDEAFTLSAWVNLDDITHTNNVIFGLGYNNSDNYGFLVQRTDHPGLTFQSTNQGYPPGASFTTPSQNISATTWTYVILKKAAGSTVKILQNGTEITNEAMRDTGYTAGTLSIGSATGAVYFKGKIDEARFSTVERSADWITTEYNNQSSPSTFYSISSSGAGCFVHERSITIDHTKVPNTDLSNFPVLVSGTYSYLAAVGNGGYVQSASGYDIVFYADAALTTKLDHEIEKYVAATGKIEMWVRIPTLSHTSDTVFYMAYGDNTLTTSEENKTGVWDSNFRGIWHMGNGTTLSAQDSTSNGNNGTINGATAATGQIGGSASFSGSSQNITTPASIDLDDAFTLSAWVNLDDITHTSNVIFGFGYNNSDNYGFLVQRTDHPGLTLQSTNQSWPPGCSFTTPSQNISAATWTYVVLKKAAGSTVKILQNGTEITNEAMRDTGYTAATLRIGSATGAVYFKGKIDEARFSTVERSADWVKTEYNNQSSPSSFFTIGSAQ